MGDDNDGGGAAVTSFGDFLGFAGDVLDEGKATQRVDPSTF